MSAVTVISLSRTANKDVLFHQLSKGPEQLWETERQRFLSRSPVLCRLIDDMIRGWTKEMKATLASGLSMLSSLPSHGDLIGMDASDAEANAEVVHMDSKVAINFHFLLHRLLDTSKDVRRVDLAFGRLHRIIRQNQ